MRHVESGLLIVVFVLAVFSLSSSRTSPNLLQPRDMCYKGNHTHVGPDCEAFPSDKNDTEVSPELPEARNVLPESEWVDDFEWNISVTCSTFKCVYPSKRDHRVGYLVGQTLPKHTGAKAKFLHRGIEEMENAWELAEELKQKFGIHHLSLAPPKEVDCPDDIISKMNRNTHTDQTGEILKQQHRKTYKKVFQKVDPKKPWTKLMVQPIEIVKSPFVQYGASKFKTLSAMENLKSYTQQLNITNVTKWTMIMLEELERTRKLLEVYPCFVHDFQVLFDGDGNMQHIDFDRCFEIPGVPALAKEATSNNETEMLKGNVPPESLNPHTALDVDMEMNILYLNEFVTKLITEVWKSASDDLLS